MGDKLHVTSCLKAAEVLGTRMVVGGRKQRDLTVLDVRGKLGGRGAGPQGVVCPSGSRGGSVQLSRGGQGAG